MKIYQLSKVFLPILLAMALSALVGGCGSSSTTANQAAGPVTPTATPIAIEFLNGAAGIPLDASFQQTYSHELDSSTVSGNSVFIVLGAAQTNIASSNIKSFDSGLCDVSKKISASITLSSDKKTITITPSSNLAKLTTYYLGMTGLKYLNGTPIDGICIHFTTADTLPSMFISSITTDAYYDINLANTPLKVKFNDAINANSVKDFYVTSSVITEDGNATLDGTWALDTTDTEEKTAKFTPTEAVPDCSLMYVNMPVTARDASNTPFGSIAASGYLFSEFTTLYYYDADFTATAFQNIFSTCWGESFTPGNSNTFSFTSNGLIYTGPAPYNYGGSWGSYVANGKSMTDNKFTATLYIKSLSLNSEGGYENRGGIGLGVRGGGDSFQIVAFIKGGALYFALTQDLGNTFTNQTANMANGEVWLKMQKSGTSYTASYSTDGTNFTQLGGAFTSSLINANNAAYTLEIPLYFQSGVVENFTGVIKSLTFSW